MAAITICSDFGAPNGAPKNEVWHCFHCFPIYFPWSDGTRCHVFWMLNSRSRWCLNTLPALRHAHASEWEERLAFHTHSTKANQMLSNAAKAQVRESNTTACLRLKMPLESQSSKPQTISIYPFWQWPLWAFSIVLAHLRFHGTI